MVAESLIHISMNYLRSLQLHTDTTTHTVFLHVLLHAAFRNCSCAKLMSPFEDRNNYGICYHFINTTFASLKY